MNLDEAVDLPGPEEVARRIRLVLGLIVNEPTATEVALRLREDPPEAEVRVTGRDVVTGLDEVGSSTVGALTAAVLP